MTISIDRWLALAGKRIESRVPGLTAKPSLAYRVWERGDSSVRVYAATNDEILGAFTTAAGRFGCEKIVRRYRAGHVDLVAFVGDVEAHFGSGAAGAKVLAFRDPRRGAS